MREVWCEGEMGEDKGKGDVGNGKGRERLALGQWFSQVAVRRPIRTVSAILTMSARVVGSSALVPT
ncbi:hypothetical protein Acsp05_20470 [Actinokineospora sp. NBRC 105648]|nr:hypothetical protein Acsp05_20470 [Actinokineospora sp. NBRC 105648]